MLLDLVIINEAMAAVRNKLEHGEELIVSDHRHVIWRYEEAAVEAAAAGEHKLTPKRWKVSKFADRDKWREYREAMHQPSLELVQELQLMVAQTDENTPAETRQLRVNAAHERIVEIIAGAADQVLGRVAGRSATAEARGNESFLTAESRQRLRAFRQLQ
jgi:hypothetical protein